jgi:hypothetical protein
MSNLQLSQVVTLCLKFSGSPHNIGRAVGIAWLESGLNPSARCYNVRDPRTGKVVCGQAGPNVLSIDRGLFQINSKSHKEISDATADDPTLATGAAFHISGGFTNWGEWSSRTFLPGGANAGTARGQAAARIIANAEDEAKAQLSREKGPSPLTAATAAVGGVAVATGSAAADAAKGAVKATLSVGEFLAHISERAVWIRVLEVIGGAGAIILGAFLLDRSLVSQVAGSAVSNAVGGAANKLGASAVARGSFRPV